jgi:hypothetical protein
LPFSRRSLPKKVSVYRRVCIFKFLRQVRADAIRSLSFSFMAVFSRSWAVYSIMFGEFESRRYWASAIECSRSGEVTPRLGLSGSAYLRGTFDLGEVTGEMGFLESYSELILDVLKVFALSLL